MPTQIDLEPALLRWQAKHQRRLTYEELARMAGISIAALYRIKSGNTITPDLRKINAICKILECEPGDLIVRHQTGMSDENTRWEARRIEITDEINARVKSK
jgi:DNA-binding Xre family transcriptional regulator